MPTLGLCGTDVGPCATADGASQISVLAEQLGYDSPGWGRTSSHPSPRVPPSTIEPDFPILDPLVTLGLVAGEPPRAARDRDRDPAAAKPGGAGQGARHVGRRERRAAGVRHGHGVCRARDAGGGRADGWPRRARGRVSAGHALAVGRRRSRLSWPTRRVRGRRGSPRPAQRPIPVVVGGHTAAAHRRGVRHASGWYGFQLDRRRPPSRSPRCAPKQRPPAATSTNSRSRSARANPSTRTWCATTGRSESGSWC